MITDDELSEMEMQYFRMKDDPYYPSDPKLLELILELKQYRQSKKNEVPR